VIDNVERFAAFVNERHAVYMRKWWLERQAAYEAGGAASPAMSSKMLAAWNSGDPPTRGWSLDRLTNDPILREYRFTNVYRELDRVTVQLREMIREPYADHEHLWWMYAVARQFNWPPTAKALFNAGVFPVQPGFKPSNMTAVVEGLRVGGAKTETGAFFVRAESNRNAPWYNWSKTRYLCEIVLGRLWEDRDALQGVIDGGFRQSTLREVWEFLQQPRYIGYGPFVAGQFVTDLRWTRYLRDAPDINTWTAIGPGSRRGLNRLHGREVTAALSQERGLAEMVQLREEIANRGLLASWVSLPDLSDVQNCTCEYDKIERVRLGEGRPRAIYVPGRGC
jgi:hypothetical protein